MYIVSGKSLANSNKEIYSIIMFVTHGEFATHLLDLWNNCTTLSQKKIILSYHNFCEDL